MRNKTLHCFSTDEPPTQNNDNEMLDFKLNSRKGAKTQRNHSVAKTQKREKIHQ
jgi:hypothetical protein